jgi:hypothetical protein
MIDLNFLYSIKDEDEQLDYILDHFDMLCYNSQFDQVDEILKNVNLTKLNKTSILGILAITKPAKTQLKQRQNFVKEVVQILDNELTQNLL